MMLLHTIFRQSKCCSSKVLQRTEIRLFYYHLSKVNFKVGVTRIGHITPQPHPKKIPWCISISIVVNLSFILQESYPDQTRFKYLRSQRSKWPDFDIWHTPSSWCNYMLISVNLSLAVQNIWARHELDKILDMNWTRFFYLGVKGQRDLTLLCDTSASHNETAYQVLFFIQIKINAPDRIEQSLTTIGVNNKVRVTLWFPSPLTLLQYKFHH